MPSINDWQPYTHNVNQTDLDFNIQDDFFEVTSRLDVERKDPEKDSPFFLNGTNLELLHVSVNEVELGNNEYTLDDDGLTIHNLPEQASVSISQRIEFSPHAVDGLYKSDETLVTQCEDEAFRKIAFYPDRPDVLSKFKVRIEADMEKYPVLLSNGNEQEYTELEDGRHAKTFIDEFPKPCYLFALVAGDLVSLSSTYQRQDGSDVELAIYSDDKSIRHCVFALEALKRSMFWDELVYERVYDLDRFSIVAVNKFLFGAMENKSLNVFNAQVLHASPDVATDANYERIEGVVAHEYFHNYSGNRVTVRDWFQLSLKEGFTVFRDQSYTRSLIGQDLGRIQDADFLRNEQFPEAQSSLAHPVRPEEMTVPANYYTRTIYEGGAELIYMLSNFMGRGPWLNATNHYFEKHDHQAVTIDDWLEAISESSGRDLSQFSKWYSTSGTPRVRIEEHRDGDTITLRLQQSIPPTADQAEKPILQIPIGIGLVDAVGSTNLLEHDGFSFEDMVDTELEASEPDPQGTMVFLLDRAEAEIQFTATTDDVLVSAHRDFSAPIELTYINGHTGNTNFDRLAGLVIADTNYYVRWDSMQQIYAASVLDWEQHEDRVLELIDDLLKTDEGKVDTGQGRRLRALMLKPPQTSRILDLYQQTPVETILEGQENLLLKVFEAHGDQIRVLADQNHVTQLYDPGSEQASQRALRHVLYRYLSAEAKVADPSTLANEFASLYRAADNLTDRLGFFQLLLRLDGVEELQSEIQQDFYDRFKHEPLVVEKWIASVVGAPIDGAVARIEQIKEMGLLDSPVTPNRWRSVYFSYGNNWDNFHQADGSGYTYLTDQLLKDAETMGGVTSRGVQFLAYYHRHDLERKEKMRECLLRLQKDLPEKLIPMRDMVDRALAEVPQAA